jgi:hypothetical protein
VTEEHYLDELAGRARKSIFSGKPVIVGWDGTEYGIAPPLADRLEPCVVYPGTPHEATFYRPKRSL